ncbi:MAG: integrin alpha [Planctomycetota bacterium]
MSTHARFGRTASLFAILALPAAAQKQLYEYIGDSNQLSLSSEIRPAGDVDGDGFGDFVLGAPRADPSGQSSGEARLFSGATGASIRVLQGASAGDALGDAAVGLGDLDGDGRSELLVGAPGAGTGGEAYVFRGIDGTVLYAYAAASSLDDLGEDVALLGDTDLDGVPDFAVSADRDNTGPNGTSGAVRVYSGATGALRFTRFGASSNDRFGTRVRGAGDVNGDGRGDLLVAATDDDDNGSMSGVVFMLSGLDGSTLWTRSGLAAGDRFGATLDASGADMSGDGVPDVVVGTEDSNYALVLSGASGSTLRTHDQFDSGGGTGAYGRSVATLGDIDGDGLGDYAIADRTAYVQGQVRVHSGATGDELYVLTWINQNHSYGRGLGSVGDLDGDGIDEFGIGATGFDTPTIGNAGRVTIHSPQPPIGTVYCSPATVGSSGRAATIRAYGSTDPLDNCLTLTVSGFVPGEFGYFVVGDGPASVVPPNTIGTLCVGGTTLGRFNRAEQFVRGPGGSLGVDLSALPTIPTRSVQPGETWYFQCWFRDRTPGGAPTSNFSEAVAIGF